MLIKKNNGLVTPSTALVLADGTEYTGCQAGCGPEAPSTPDPSCRPTQRVSVETYDIGRAAEAMRVDRALIRAILGARPRSPIPLVTPFGCYRFHESMPEDGPFDTYWSPLHQMITGGLYQVDQKLSVTNTQGDESPSGITSVIQPSKSAAYRIMGCRIEYDTTSQQAPANNARTEWLIAPYNYNASCSNIRFDLTVVLPGVVTGITETPKLTNSNRQQWSMAPNVTGGAYVLFALRQVVPEFAAGPPGESLSMTVATDAFIQDVLPAFTPGEESPSSVPLRAPMNIRAITTGLVPGAQISQSVTVIAPGQPHFEHFVSTFLSHYYESTSTSVSW